MKKIIFIFLFLNIFVGNTKAFLGEDLGTNLYKNISDGIEELELKQYEYEISGQGDSIGNYINEVLASYSYGTNCINENISIEDVEEIASNNIETLYNNINDECKSEQGDISQEKLSNIQNIINIVYNITKDKATDKTQKINDISRIGIYSDGSTLNSPFDLMTDLENIDYYIFTQEIEYNGEVLEDNDELIDDIFSSGNNLNKYDGLSSSSSSNNDDKDNYYTSNYNSNNNDEDSESSNILTQSETYKCIDNETNSELSGLNIEEIENLINGTTSSYSSEEQSSNSISDNIIDELAENNENDGGSYTKLNDNGVFPCDSFFCITIEFITYQHNLLGGGLTQTIESLVNRSNKHLKKFAGTSLIQSEMTTNNWEFGLKDLNLPNIFHVGFIITSKPVPILDIKQDEEKEDKTKYTKDNLLEEYYKNYGLEYSRKNDINIFNGEYDELKSVLDLAELPIGATSNKLDEYNKLREKELEKNNFVSKSVLEKISNDNLSDFEERLIELNKFSNSILEYIDSIDGTIRFMDTIPVDKG